MNSSTVYFQRKEKPEVSYADEMVSIWDRQIVLTNIIMQKLRSLAQAQRKYSNTGSNASLPILQQFTVR